jgi:heme-binding NEAT domain protein
MVFEPGAATTSVATNSRNTPRGPKVKRWTSGVSAPGYILLIIVVAWVLVEVLVAFSRTLTPQALTSNLQHLTPEP